MEQAAIAELLLRSSQDGVLAFDKQFRYTYWNSKMEELLAISAAQVVGRVAFEVFPFLKEMGEEHHFRNALAGKTSVAHTRPFTLPSTGKLGYFETHYSPLKDLSGQLMGGMAIIRDVTSRVHNEAHERFRALVEQSPIAMTIFSPDGSGTYANRAWEEFWESNKADMPGYNILQDPHTEQPGIRPLIERALKGERITLPDSYYDPKLNNKAGRARWIRTHFFPIRDPNGELVEVANTFEDISDSRALSEERQKFATLFAQSPAILALVRGPDFIFEKVNEAYLQLVGFRDVIGKTLVEALPEIKDSPFPAILKRVFETGQPYHARESRMSLQRTPDGSPVDAYFNFTCQRLDGPDGKPYGIHGTAIDVTEQVLARRKVENLAEDLQAAVNARDTFLSIASHELRTPVTSMKMQTQMMQRSIAKGDPGAFSPERVGQMVDQTDSSLNRLTRLIDDMLDVSRVQAGKLALLREKCSLAAITAEVLERFQAQLASCNMPVKLEIESKPIGQWDRHRIDQVITNFVTNAIRYASGKPLTVRISSGAQRARLEFADQGPGIAKADQSKLFEKFERLISANEISGMGLGLYIVREIVHAHGGEVMLDSEEGRGARFIVELPL